MKNHRNTSVWRIGLPPQRITRAVFLAAGLGLALTAGYLWGAFRRHDFAALSVQQRVPLDFFLTERSFSEAANARERLEAVGVEFLTDVRIRHDASVLGKAAASWRGNPTYAVAPGAAIEELEKGIDEFKTTGQEKILVRELLSLLKRRKLPDRWLDVYLGHLYLHPADPLIAKAAKDALAMSAASGRQSELEEAAEFLQQIPPRFLARADGLTVDDAKRVADLWQSVQTIGPVQASVQTISTVGCTTDDN